MQKMRSAGRYGMTVKCTFGDEVFIDCVLSSKRDQVLQAFITGLSVGVYVVAKVEDGLGEIVQVVICHIPEEKIMNMRN